MSDKHCPILVIKSNLRNQENDRDNRLKTVIYAFQLHFNPQHATGVMDKDSYAILQALNYKYNDKYK